MAGALFFVERDKIRKQAGRILQFVPQSTTDADIVLTCRLNGVNPFDYQLAIATRAEAVKLIPKAWLLAAVGRVHGFGRNEEEPIACHLAGLHKPVLHPTRS